MYIYIYIHIHIRVQICICRRERVWARESGQELTVMCIWTRRERDRETAQKRERQRERERDNERASTRGKGPEETEFAKGLQQCVDGGKVAIIRLLQQHLALLFH